MLKNSLVEKLLLRFYNLENGDKDDSIRQFLKEIIKYSMESDLLLKQIEQQLVDNNEAIMSNNGIHKSIQLSKNQYLLALIQGRSIPYDDKKLKEFSFIKEKKSVEELKEIYQNALTVIKHILNRNGYDVSTSGTIGTELVVTIIGEYCLDVDRIVENMQIKLIGGLCNIENSKLTKKDFLNNVVYNFNIGVNAGITIKVSLHDDTF